MSSVDDGGQGRWFSTSPGSLFYAFPFKVCRDMISVAMSLG